MTRSGQLYMEGCSQHLQIPQVVSPSFYVYQTPSSIEPQLLTCAWITFVTDYSRISTAMRASYDWVTESL